MAVLLLRRRLRYVLPLGGAFIVAAGCASFDDSAGGAPSAPGLSDAGKGGVVLVDGAVADATAPGSEAINPLCGLNGFCDAGVPDDPLACSQHDVDGGLPPKSDGGLVTTSPDGGVLPGDAGALDAGADASAAIPAADAGLPGQGASDASADAAVPPAPPSTSPGGPGGPGPGGPLAQSFSCQVVADDTGNPSRRCAIAGTGAEGSPCSSGNQCQSGLACAGQVGGAGQCLPYCCQPTLHPCGSENTHDGGVEHTFCGDRVLFDGKETTLHVPVCVPAEACLLSEHYPCTAGTTCTCKSGTACTVVKPDGTTGCVTPGTGKSRDACPCAAGYYCSTQNQCVKICKTTDTTTCSPGKCQASAGFPDGFGLCIGLQPTLQ
jgi:hypothetical protein